MSWALLSHSLLIGPFVAVTLSIPVNQWFRRLNPTSGKSSLALVKSSWVHSKVMLRAMFKSKICNYAFLYHLQIDTVGFHSLGWCEFLMLRSHNSKDASSLGQHTLEMSYISSHEFMSSMTTLWGVQKKVSGFGHAYLLWNHYDICGFHHYNYPLW